MKLGLRLPTFALDGDFSSYDVLRNYVQRAEECGVEGFFVIDHLLITPPAYACSWHDALTAVSFIAAATKHARVGTMVLVLPTRNPYFLAKQLASIDVYSGGRLVLGAGVGWNVREFELAGVPVSKRGRIMDEYLVLLKMLWSACKTSFDGEFFRVRELEMLPKPVQKPHPPIWIGGGSQPFEKIYGEQARGIERVLARVAKHADGWIPHSSATAEMAAKDWETVKSYAREYGRDPYNITRIYSNFIYIKQPGEPDAEAAKRFSLYSGMDLDYWREYYLLGTVDELARKIRARINALEGVDWVVLNPLTFGESQLRLIADELFPKIEKQ
ncbi:MAG: TIGR03619 family F420-dependent LLM class oxidoreductase [Aigarchaeota archaeon]|nr:TIGR03619 family F420-dependent LLM class oxidoreductase [Candidatus Pelearchaeum maunauluense]